MSQTLRPYPFQLALAIFLAGAPLLAQERPPEGAAAEIEQLRQMLADQQKQIDELRRMLVEQTSARVLPAPAVRPLRLGEIASFSPILPLARPAPVIVKPAEEDAPLQWKIGDTTIQPIGFADLTGTWKDKNAGGTVGTNFGSIPYSNVPGGKLSEFRFSSQISRLGFRLDGDWKGVHYLGYSEFDFMGTSGSNNLSVSSGAFVPRMRMFLIDLRMGKFEIMAGQAWSMLTPNRKGLSPLPEDLFVGFGIDLNAVNGLPWTRQPGVRFLYHPSEKWTLGASFENPDQYIGVSAGGPGIVLPSALTSLGGGQLDNSSNVQLTPNAHPDFILKAAFDPTPRFHIEAAAIERTFRVWNPNASRRFMKSGGGFSLNTSVGLTKNIRFVSNHFWSEGGGRYLAGNAPDVIVRSDGSLSPIKAAGIVSGFEWKIVPALQLYAYYGGAYIDRNTAVDANGTTLIGYGFRGSANTQNRTMHEVTFGFNRTLWKDPRYGALNAMSQYAYVLRNPWFMAPDSPKNAHDNTVFMSMRYTLPGRAPAPPLH